MSYTHVWRRPARIPDSAWARIRNDMALTLQLFDASAGDPSWREAGLEPVALRGPDGTGSPVISPVTVAFNGDVRRRGAADPFLFPQCADDTVESGHIVEGRCDTALLPYDLSVCSALLVAKYHLGHAMILDSDGAPGELAWPIAREVAGTVLGLHGTLVRGPDTGIAWSLP